MARALKFKLGQGNGKKLIHGSVEYHKEEQRELQYEIERIETIGSLEMAAHSHNSVDESSERSPLALPGFVWTIIMKR